jgi:hypothetical protein
LSFSTGGDGGSNDREPSDKKEKTAFDE